jgi:hypothetical protein
MIMRNAHLYFVRSVMINGASEHYYRNTDVWVFGDIPGYEWWFRTLDRLPTRKKPLVLRDVADGTKCMRVVLMPVATSPRGRARLRMIERLVSIRKSPQMELVIRGNERGIRHLRQVVSYLIEKHRNVPQKYGLITLHDHTHVEPYWDPAVVPGSVQLNIRGPITVWSRRTLSYYAQSIYKSNPHALRDDAGSASEPYELSDPSDESLSLRVLWGPPPRRTRTVSKRTAHRRSTGRSRS